MQQIPGTCCITLNRLGKKGWWCGSGNGLLNLYIHQSNASKSHKQRCGMGWNSRCGDSACDLPTHGETGSSPAPPVILAFGGVQFSLYEHVREIMQKMLVKHLLPRSFTRCWVGRASDTQHSSDNVRRFWFWLYHFYLFCFNFYIIKTKQFIITEMIRWFQIKFGGNFCSTEDFE